jgi:hypothetical protein
LRFGKDTFARLQLQFRPVKTLEYLFQSTSVFLYSFTTDNYIVNKHVAFISY